MTTAERAELLRLLAALCDGQATDAEHSRLEAILSSGADARRTYLEYVDLHARLMTHPGLSKGRKMPPKEAWAWADLEEAAGMERRAAAWNARRQRGWTWQRLATYAGVAAATLAATLLLQLAMHRPEPPPLAVLPAGPNAEPPHYVATLAQTSGAVWDADHAAIAAGSRLLPGALRLDQGLARIHFDSGVDLLLEAPATLRLESSKAAALLAGKLVFQAEDAAAPFILTTPASILVDTGTEYGVEVGPQREEVHVFSGEVQRDTIKKPLRSPELVPAGQARWYVAGSLAGTRLTLAPTRFIRELPSAPPAPPDPSGGLLAYEGFVYPQPTDFKDGKGTGGNGWNGPWEFDGLPMPFGNKQQWTLNVERSLIRPDAPSASQGGSYDYVGVARYQRKLATPLRLDADGVYYLSILIRREGLARHSRNRIGVHFRDDDEVSRKQHPPPDVRKRLTVGIEHANFLCAKLEDSCPKRLLPLSYDEPYLLVAKVVASAAHPDQVFVRVYSIEEPVDAAEPANWSLEGKEVNSNRTFEWLQIEIESAKRQTLDELRLGSTWLSVTAPYVVQPQTSP